MADEKLAPIGQTFSDFKSGAQPVMGAPSTDQIGTAPSLPSQRFLLDKDGQITGSSNESAPLFNPLEAVGRRLSALMTLPEDAGDQGEAVVKDKEGTDYPVDYRIDREEDGTGRVTLTDKRSVKEQANLAQARADLSTRNSALQLENNELAEQATFDKLTGVLNRRGFDLEAEKFLQKLNAKQGSGLVLMLDLDDFKPVNDKYGHPTGDRVLRELAQLLTRILRPEDLISRWGGEEFAVLLSTEHHPEKILDIAERIRATIAEHIFDSRHHSIQRSVSIGMARFDPPFRAPSLTELVEEADQALYAAKHNGKNAYAYTTNGETIISGADRKVTIIKTPSH